IAEDKTLAGAKANVKPTAFEVHGGELVAAATTPGKSVYEVKLTVPMASLTAVRIENLPVKADSARRTPGFGFIVNKVDAWIVGANGREKKILFHNFVPDSESNLSDAVDRAVKAKPGHQARAVTGGFAADPSLFQSRWLVAVPASPIPLTRGSHLEIHLTQIDTISSKPSLVKSAKLYASSDSRWTELSSDPGYNGNLRRLTTLEKQLEK